MRLALRCRLLDYDKAIISLNMAIGGQHRLLWTVGANW